MQGQDEFVLDGTYGKQSVPVCKILKDPSTGVHRVLDMMVQIICSGAVEKSWLTGDNSQILPTETQKNTCYVTALKTEFDCGEDYAVALGTDILTRHTHLTGIDVTVAERLWDRVSQGGVAHNHGFTSGSGPIATTCKVSLRRQGGPDLSVSVEAGVQNLRLLKTSQSGFEGFIRDEYTNLKPIGQGADSTSATRLCATEMTASWTYAKKPPQGYAAAKSRICELLVSRFVGKAPDGEFSKSVQETAYKMSCDVLKELDTVESVSLITPNIHFYRFDSEQFGFKNDNVVFQSTEPHNTASGRIHTNVSRRHMSRL